MKILKMYYWKVMNVEKLGQGFFKTTFYFKKKSSLKSGNALEMKYKLLSLLGIRKNCKRLKVKINNDDFNLNMCNCATIL